LEWITQEQQSIKIETPQDSPKHVRGPSFRRRNADVEAEIAQLRAQLLHADQSRELVQNQLQEEKEERERAQRKVWELKNQSPK